jgi:hypothetical protein
METRCVGSLNVSVVGLGCNNFGRRVDAEGTSRVKEVSKPGEVPPAGD